MQADKTPKPHPTSIEAVLFDFDGTLTKPGAIDFDRVRQAIDCPPGQPILEYIASIEDSHRRGAAQKTLHRLEMQAAAHASPNDGAEELVLKLSTRNIPLGIVTRNSQKALDAGLKNFKRIGAQHFQVVLTRDAPIAPKPSPAGILWSARQFGKPTAAILVVGDFIHDVDAGNRAGAKTAYLDNGHTDPAPLPCDFRISKLTELEPLILDGGRPNHPRL